MLCLELTETALIDARASTQARLHELKSLGVQLALDDFGTGWSSLSYLRRFPIDIIKIDRSFIAGLGVDQAATHLVRTVLGLAESFDLLAIAEGVETPQQHDMLCELGCDQGQGFLYGRPSPAAELPGSPSPTGGQPSH